MDIPRYALIAASVLLGLMLLGEWTQFSTAQQEAALPAVPMVDTMVETEAGGSDVANEMAVSSGVPQDDLDLPAVEDIYKIEDDIATYVPEGIRLSETRDKAAKKILQALATVDIQQIVGMLLWVYRCCRWEIGYGVCLLAARIHKWEEDAAIQLLLLISYLRKDGNFTRKRNYQT